MIGRRRRCLPIESDSSQDDNSKRRKLQSTNTITSQPETNKHNSGLNNSKTRGGPSYVLSEEDSSTSEDEETIHVVRHSSMRALSDYDTGNSSGNVEDSLSPRIHHNANLRTWPSGAEPNESSDSSRHSVVQIRSGKRCLRTVESSTSTDSSDSGLPIGFQRKKKVIKLSSSTGNSSSDSESSSEVFYSGKNIIRLRLDNNVSSEENPNTSNTSRNSASSRIAQNCSDSNEQGSTGEVVRNNWRRLTNIRINSDSESSHDVIKPRVLHNSRTIFYSDSSSSDSDDHVPIKMLKRRKPVRIVIDSDEDTNSQQNNSDDDDDNLCPICLNSFNLKEVGKPSTCGHSFCLACIEQWANTNNTCPIDRRPFNSISVLTALGGAPVREIPVNNIQLIENDWLDPVIRVVMLAESGEESSVDGYFSSDEVVVYDDAEWMDEDETSDLLYRYPPVVIPEIHVQGLGRPSIN